MDQQLSNWSVRLTAAFLILFTAWLAYVRLTPMPRPTFFSDPVHAAIILTAVAAAVAGGVLGIVAIVAARARSLGVFLAVAVGALVTLWTVAEIIGH